MKNLNVYIEEMLYLHNCVIVPEFGAFISNRKNAELLQNKTLTAPQKEVTFNQRLSYNDGLVAKHIAEEERITYEAAQEYIKTESKKWKESLNEGKKLHFENLGFFHQEINAEGVKIYIFEPDTKENFLTDSFGMSPVATQEVVKEQEVINPVLNGTSQQGEMLENPLASSEESQEKTTKKRKIGTILKYAAVALVGLSAIGYGVFFFLTQMNNPAAELAQADPEAVKAKVEEHISTATFLPENPLDLAGSPVVWEGKKDPELAKKMAEEAKKREKEAAELAKKEALAQKQQEEAERRAEAIAKKEEERIRREEAKKEKEALAKNESSSPKSTAVSGNFHLIAGAFSTEANARNKVKQLKEKGFSDANVIGKNDKGLFLVVYKSFSQQAEAQSYMQDVKKQGFDTWLLSK